MFHKEKYPFVLVAAVQVWVFRKRACVRPAQQLRTNLMGDSIQ